MRGSKKEIASLLQLHIVLSIIYRLLEGGYYNISGRSGIWI